MAMLYLWYDYLDYLNYSKKDRLINLILRPTLITYSIGLQCYNVIGARVAYV